MSKILFLSDLHGRLPNPSSMPDIDLLLLGGDIAPLGAIRTDPELELASEWIKSHFAPWLDEVKAQVKCEIIGSAGNHDFFAEYPWGERLLRSLNWYYLRDQLIEFNGLKIFGMPWSPPHPMYPDWAFQQADHDLKRQWAKIPSEIDILLVHTPPHGVLDKLENGDHVGSKSLTEHLVKSQPLRRAIPLICCGHIHEDGMLSEEFHNSLVVNGSMTTVKHVNRQTGMLINYQTDNIDVSKVKLRVPDAKKSVRINPKVPISFYVERHKKEQFDEPMHR